MEGSFTDLTAGSSNILIGTGLARELNVELGDDVILLLPEARPTPAGMFPRNKAFSVVGIFDVGMYEYDRGLVFIPMQSAALLYRTDGRANGLSLEVDDIYSARSIVTEVARDLGGGFYVSDWTRRHANVFRSIQLTKPILFIMLSLVIGVAAFNIVSTLVMVVREKRGDIAILRSFGSTPRNILSLFAAHGTVIGVIGTLGGLALGLLLVVYLQPAVQLIENWFDVELLAGDVYLINDLPAEARIGEILQICLLSMTLAIVATFYPAYSASRQPPAEALRYE